MNVIVHDDGTLRDKDTLELLGYHFVLGESHYYMLNEDLDKL